MIRAFAWFTLISVQAHSAWAFQLSIHFDETVPPEAQTKILTIRDQVEEIVRDPDFQTQANDYKNYSCLGPSNLPDGVISIGDAVAFIQKSQADINISFFYKESSTRAQTGPKMISFNTYYFNTDQNSAIANTLFHESLHSIDFGHCGKNNIRLFPKIKRSIPYRFGDLVEKLYKH